MRKLFLSMLMLVGLVPMVSGESCFQIHGRAVDYRGDAFFAIWHIGTHHEFFLVDKKSIDLVCQYFDCESPDRQPALFADFTLCPTKPFKAGAAQPAIVKNIEHPRVVSDWPVSDSPREFVNQFYNWYAPRALTEDTPAGWLYVLKWIRLDLSPQLAKLIEKDAAIQSPCTKVVGLDFDPILFTQKPDEKYQSGEITQQTGHYFANIYRISSGEKSKNPDVIAEFVRQGDHWVFLNFHYPSEKTDLLSLLNSPKSICARPLDQK